ncbi:MULTISPECIES: sugar ABC transporter permease [unclassified Microbacterium]|uniref:sugar ABC transporter permease n=1 Tax=unclassified Microbacterium TaxID=2609290 RepID=UPI000B10742E|nr:MULTISPECIES: sugar ABC transporter permease [unclassified Microbacterium]MBN9191915.1 sugar ABC transporter permease [Microbacterium sp.]
MTGASQDRLTSPDHPEPDGLDAGGVRGAIDLVTGRVRGSVELLVTRVRGGDLGSLPVVIGLVVIWTVFQSLNPVFLSSTNLVNLTMQCAAIGTIALGVVVVLLVGEIDLSVGSVSGLAAAILAVTLVQLEWNPVFALLAAAAAGAAAGLLYGLLYTRFGVPSFVLTLAGLLGFLGLQLSVLGDTGSINLPFDSAIVQFAQQLFLPAWVSYLFVVLTVAVYAWTRVRGARRRASANLVSQSYLEIAVRSAGLLAFLAVVAWYLNLSRGVGVMFLFFLALVVAMNILLTRTRWGRAVYAVGGSGEAARRAGIRVRGIYVSVFMICSTLAAVGGILAAARLAAANQSSGVGDTNLNAIAAAVIGGTSLFGGRGTAFSALLGIIVIQSISSGLTLLNLDASVRYMVTGVVLVLAVIVDAMSRRTRAATGRA